MRIYTIGHSTHPIEEFIALLKRHDIETLVDVRSHPGSRKYPWFGQDELRRTLMEQDIRYQHIRSLGGRRSGIVEDSGNEGWHVPAFRSYADYAQSDAFFTGLEQLEQIASTSRVAYMCSEHTHLRCHRRIISDYLKARGWHVLHITSRGQLEEHVYTEHAEVRNGQVRYPARKEQMDESGR